MNTLVLIVALGAIAWILAARQAPLWAWTGAAGGMLGLYTLYGAAPTPLLAGLWSALLGFVLVFHLSPLRLRLFTAPVLRAFRRAMPPISATEREALDAGSVWWEAALYSGRPDWRRLLRFPTPVLSAEERGFLDGPVEQLCGMLDDWRINDRDHDLPPQVWRFMRSRRMFGMIIPKQYGGLGFSAYAHSLVVMKLASRCLTAAITVMVPNSLGPAELLLRYGTRQQKEYYLPRLARGEEIPCFALTGPQAGSDASAIPDSGVVCRDRFGDRSDVLGIRLDWDKRYITLAPVATLLGLAFRLHDPQRLLGGSTEPGITLALVPTDLPGVEIGRRHRPLDVPFQNGPTSGKGVFIPIDYIIGGADHAGHGWRMLVSCLAVGRAISLPALSVGGAKLACRTTGAYARVRRQFNLPIGRFEGVAEVLGRMAARTYRMDAARIMTLGAIDRGEQPAVVGAMLKYHLTEGMRAVVTDAMDVHGGRAICMGPRNYLARSYQAQPISITVEGANILTRSLILFGQGAVRCHPWLRREMEAAADPEPSRGLRGFDIALRGHMGYLLGSMARSLFQGLGGGRLLPVPRDGGLAPWFRRLNRMSSALALVSEFTLLRLGGGLKRHERLSARLGDVLSLLYLASASLHRFAADGFPEQDRPLLEWACADALYTMQQRLLEVLRNFPGPLLGALMRRWIFPFGAPYRGPSDACNQRAAELLLAPGEARDRLTAGIYLATDRDEPVARLELALSAAIQAEAAESKLKAARRDGSIARNAGVNEALQAGILTPAEVGRLRQAERTAQQVIRVDDFAAWDSLEQTAPAAPAAALGDVRLAAA